MMIKAAFAAAALVGAVSAGHHQHRHVHNLFKDAAKRNSNDSEVCVPGCTTVYSTVTGSAGLWTPTSLPATSTPPPVPLPTPIVTVCPTPGTYTFPATTVIVKETTTVCAATTSTLPSGTHTVGGVTTVVTTSTTIVCPVATTTTNSKGDVTSIIKTTTTVCPSAGTYTIAPVTTTVTKTVEVVVIPVVTTYCPGTYTAPPTVTTVTDTKVVVVCPLTNAESSSSATATASAKPTSSAAATATSAAATSTSTSSPSLGGTGGKAWAITYTPYDNDGQCKSGSAVSIDIQKIKDAGFAVVRVYSTDCNTLEHVGSACRAVGLKMILGIFIDAKGCTKDSAHVAEQITAIKSWAQWDLVELMVTGNEAMFGGFCSASQLTALIIHVKAELSAAGYTGMHTTTDVVSSFMSNDVKALCNAIDIAGTNVHAYFNGAVLPSLAGDFVLGQLAIVEKICGKAALCLESGWPKRGHGDAGKSQQSKAIESIKNKCGDRTVFFSFSDDFWKADGECGCETAFGVDALFGTLLKA